MRVVGIIPSRFGSSRFPGKPLIDLSGKSMIQRVYERASQAKHLERVVVATDDQRIFDHVKSFGGEVLMTSDQHLNGTERCIEALEILNEDFDAVINIQGDEPLLQPSQLDVLSFCFNDENAQIATLAVKIKSNDILFDESKIKLVLNNEQQAMYFSRNAIPFQQKPKNEWLLHHSYLKHVGIYGFRADVLKEIASLSASDLEITESLEQLRWMQNGYKIQVRITEFDSVSVDIPEDVQRVLEILDREE